MFSSNTSQVSGAVTYIEDVFSTYLYTGNGTSQTINNGVDLSTYGGLVWIKARSSPEAHSLYDTSRGANWQLKTNSTAAQQKNDPNSPWFSDYSLTSFNTNGFSLGAYNSVNGSAITEVSWTFRKQPKFFDVVTYTGSNSAKTVTHSLGSVPGCIIVKDTTAATNWYVYHRSTGNTGATSLNTTDAFGAGSGYWNNTDPTATQFTVGTNLSVTGRTYVAYLFAHNAGGFGLTGTDNVISCGSYTGNGTGGDNGGPIVTLGYEPQWVLIKNYSAATTNSWVMMDTMRGLQYGNDSPLWADLTDSEQVAQGNYITPLADGFQLASTSGGVNNLNKNFIYIAIRRGPMKVPTSGTSVFKPVTYAGDATNNRAVSVGFPVDLALVKNRTSVVYNATRDRLVGSALFINASSTGGTNATNNYGFTGPLQNTHYIPESGTAWNASANNYILEAFKRAPSFLDIVCYTGTGSARALTHNLTVAPQLIFVVSRSLSQNWNVYAEPLGNTNYLISNLTDPYGTSSTRWNNTSPTSTQFTVGTQATVNSSGATYVAYLFATCAGVSKVGSYTGTGALQTINCGFTSGARFVMIKYADGVGDWYYWDSARGITSGNDPYLAINSTSAETTSTNYVDTDATGFKVTAAAPAELNSVGGTYIYLAIA